MNTILDNYSSILVVDDDKNIRYSLTRMFSEEKLEVFEAKSGEEAIEFIKKKSPDLILMDIKMSGMSGLETLKEIKNINPKLLVIIMTAFGTTQTAIEAMKYGAYDYLIKPFDISRMRTLVENALSINQMMKNSVSFEGEKYEQGVGEHIVGNSFCMQEVYKMIGQVAEKDITVLILGESGTGKELVARAIYHHSKRNNKPYIAINCAAIPETLLESELFGHEKGAFTDAHIRRIGKFEQCNGGTIFLDEIGDMSLITQSKILRVLQEKEITRLGSDVPIKTNVRLIAATNKDIEKAILENKFRQDLYYRLDVITINLPPLRKRKEDITLLAKYFLKKFNQEFEKNIINIDSSATEKLMNYNWPGNVRELENVIKRACVLCKGAYILPEELSFDLSEKKLQTTDLGSNDIEQLIDELYNKIINSSDYLKEDIMSFLEKALIVRTLRDTNGNQLQTAKKLGMNRITLRNKINKYDIKINKDIN